MHVNGRLTFLKVFYSLYKQASQDKTSAREFVILFLSSAKVQNDKLNKKQSF